MNYDEFLHSKIEVAPVSGFSVRPQDINPALKPHQRDAVMWAIKGGRRALFESFGLGKTVQELEWCRLVSEHEHGKVLIVLPLGVRQEFSRDAVQLLGMKPPVYVRTMAEAEAADAQILMTNYERVRDDISRMKTLNTAQSQRRKQLHVCPLQLDIVERVINRYSNPGDVVFDPFSGLGTVPMMAVRMGRKGYGCELNSGYFADAVGYLRAEEAEVEQPSLFDLLEAAT